MIWRMGADTREQGPAGTPAGHFETTNYWRMMLIVGDVQVST